FARSRGRVSSLLRTRLSSKRNKRRRNSRAPPPSRHPSPHCSRDLQRPPAQEQGACPCVVVPMGRDPGTFQKSSSAQPGGSVKRERRIQMQEVRIYGKDT